MVVLILALLWLILSAYIFAVILAAGWPAETPAAAADPYAPDVAAFRRELNDWDRNGGRS